MRDQLKISFDLDDTLICKGVNAPQDIPKYPWLCRVLFDESLRKGTTELFQWLTNEGCRVGIYTTSYRSTRYIKSLFWCYGIKLNFIVNQYIHERCFANELNMVPSKVPTAFEIDIHVDDQALASNPTQGSRCRMVVVDKGDALWVEKIKGEVSAAALLH
jgi:hypothetical protein